MWFLHSLPLAASFAHRSCFGSELSLFTECAMPFSESSDQKSLIVRVRRTADKEEISKTSQRDSRCF